MTGAATAAPVPPSAPHRRWRIAFAGLLVVAFCGFIALGVWQVQRMAWKHDLIARVDARIHAAAMPAPARTQWSAINEADDSYRRVSVSGRFVPDGATRTQAVTELGGGFWLLQPLRTEAGDYVLVNRGFVPAGGTAVPAPEGRVVVEGLLRMSEPEGGFLRRNAPQQDRWYSRDVAGIAAQLGVAEGVGLGVGGDVAGHLSCESDRIAMRIFHGALPSGCVWGRLAQRLGRHDGR